ncbi:MAG: FAD-dependent oxidoreductase [Candidatus Babeliaceae bacterium]|nr:FAD-dependent oxidoreductase [Candidatus Babeliaceae bacterium]
MRLFSLYRSFVMMLLLNVAFSLGAETIFYDVVVIGLGPGGVEAGARTASAGLKTLIVGRERGGQLSAASQPVQNVFAVSPKPGAAIMSDAIRQAEDFGAEICEGTVTNISFSWSPYLVEIDGFKKIYARALVVATGSHPRRLSVPGEEEYWGRGVSACALCDAFFYRDATVAVVGGGDAAVDEAIHLAHYAKRVVVLVRGGRMRAQRFMQEKLKQYSQIELRYGEEVEEILGNDNFVTALRLRNNKTGDRTLEKFDGLFLAIGHEPNNELLRGVLELDQRGFVRVHDGSTEVIGYPGVFATGEIMGLQRRQVNVVVGVATQTGLEVNDYLSFGISRNQIPK